MKLEIKNIGTNPVMLLRRAGYSFQRQAENEMSFVRPLAQSGYPRFHMYVRVEGGGLIINIHLDQKKETYGENTRHHGEYGDNGVLGEEIERLRKIFS